MLLFYVSIYFKFCLSSVVIISYSVYTNLTPLIFFLCKCICADFMFFCHYCCCCCYFGFCFKNLLFGIKLFFGLYYSSCVFNVYLFFLFLLILIKDHFKRIWPLVLYQNHMLKTNGKCGLFRFNSMCVILHIGFVLVKFLRNPV